MCYMFTKSHLSNTASWSHIFNLLLTCLNHSEQAIALSSGMLRKEVFFNLMKMTPSFDSNAQNCCLYFLPCTYVLCINIYIHTCSCDIHFTVNGCFVAFYIYTVHGLVNADLRVSWCVFIFMNESHQDGWVPYFVFPRRKRRLDTTKCVIFA